MIAIDLPLIYRRLEELGLVRSRREFGLAWCGRSECFVRDFERHHSKVVRAKTVATLRMRLREAADVLPAATAARVREIDEEIAKASSWIGILQRRAAMAEAA